MIGGETRMVTKLETESNGVKGLSFHSKRPWILASLRSGVIQLWDYRMATLIHRFHEHDGPVRGLHFHKSHPLFVSGGDDCKIKVWNYELRRCEFTLLGHLEYIRTVQFHHEYPWIVSASDDLTIRIWNWQSRSCISVLAGHNHYVTCASFHPKQDLLVSASLDQTVRVWDIGALRKKTASPADGILRLYRMIADFYGGFDAVVKYVLEGHNRGVKWASFHPTLPLIVSGADDCQLKVWRINGTKAWEVCTLGGHMDSVSCVLFHGRQEIIVSNSEDKSIRVWDATKTTCLRTFRREHDRFWILSAHPERNLLAAGHDSGMIVFKLERERPAFSVSGDSVFYVKDWFLRTFEYSTQKNTQLIPICRPGSNSLNQAPRTLSYSPTENAILVCSDVDGGSYELYVIPKDSYSRGDTAQEAKRGAGGSAVFVARNRFAVLDQSSNRILVKNLKNEMVKRCVLPVATDAIFYVGTGKLLCRAEDKVVIFDLQQRIVLGDLQASFVRYVVWSQDMESVALMSKYSIVIADKKLVHHCTLHETIRVKSGSWDYNGVFIYTTLTHIKYYLPNGDSGIIKTLDAPVYVTKIYGSTIFCLDRDGNNRAIIIDPTEYIFKMSLLKKRYDHVVSMIKNSELCGQAMIAYLQQKGFPQAALYFVKDERTRFNLALESGNIEKALESAKKIDEKDYWYTLGVEALRQGNAGNVEYAYQKTKSFGKLSFHYLITGNLDKLSKMMKIAEVKTEVMGQFHNALYLGDVRERVKILENAGHLPLAYITASIHGLHDVVERLSAQLGDNVPSLPEGRKASLLIPPSPVLCTGDWPLLVMSKGTFEAFLEEPRDTGMPVSHIWDQNSSHAAEHAAAGKFDTALGLLRRQLGIRNFAPLKSRFIDLYLGSHSYLRGCTSAPVLSVPLERGWRENVRGPPALIFNLSQLEEKAVAGFEAMETGKYSEAIGHFVSIIHTIPLLVVERRDVDEVKEMLIRAKEYILGLRIDLKRREVKDDPVREQELAALFTHCKLEVRHLRVALASAMYVCYDAKNLSAAANFAMHYLCYNPIDEIQVRHIMRAADSQRNMTDARQCHLNYDSQCCSVICGATYIPIYTRHRYVTCPYCATHFVPSQRGQLCTVCGLAAVGADASGLFCSPSQMR